MNGGINLYAYVGNNPINKVDPLGLSYLYYDNIGNQLVLIGSDGQVINVDTAHNNIDSSAKGPFPQGRHEIRKNPKAHQTHKDDAPSSRYGSYGSLNFDVNGRTNLAVHSGRMGQCDGLGRTGTEYCTMGCIRTTDEMMSYIIDTHCEDDPVEYIIVGPIPPLPYDY